MPNGCHLVHGPKLAIFIRETYSFSLGATPSPVTTIVQTPSSNYTCYYVPGAAFTYTTCTEDQSSALMISLSIGFFLALFLSFLKQVPPGGKPPLANSSDDDSDDEDSSANSSNAGGGGGDVSQGQQTTTESGTQTRVNGSSSATLVQRKTSTSSPSKSTTTTKHKKKKKSPPKPKYRAGIVYAEGNYYYLDFGDTHIWGHALLSFVAFGTLSLFSASVSQCLFPSIKPWIFVFTQIILLVICCFIAMFWIDDPSLSIGLMVVPQTDVQSTQTSNGAVATYTTSPPPFTPSATNTTTTAVPAGSSYNAATSTSVPMSQSSSMSPNMTMSLYPSPTSAGLANVALDDTALDAIMGQVSNNRSTAAFSVNSNRSVASIGTGVGTGAGTGTGAGANIASATIVGGSGGLGMNVGNVSRVSLFSSPLYQNQDPQVGEKGEWIVEPEEHEGEEPFSVKVE